MIGRRNLTRLSSSEMELMRMLWERGPLTLAKAHDLFGGYGAPIAYPTMQTRLNRLVAKGFAARNDERPAAYRAELTPDQTAAGLLQQLLEKLVKGSVAPLMTKLISERPLTAEEIQAAAMKYFSPNNRTVVTLVTKSETK